MRSDDTYRVLIIKRGSREVFLRKFARNHWPIYAEVQRTDKKPYQLIWTTRDEKTQVIYVQDFISRIDHFVIQGQDVQPTTEAVRTLLRDYLYTSDEIFAMWTQAQTRQEKIRAIYHIGVAASSSFEPQTYQLFQQAFSDPDSEIRLGAVWAISYIGWPQAQTLVNQVAVGDSDAEVRETAATLQRSYARGSGMGYSES